MAFDAYLDIDDIKGESLDSNFKDKIELLSFDFGATQATSATASSAGGASAERVNLKEFSVRKFIDIATPKLFEACCSGKHIKKVKLTVRRAGGKQEKYMEVELQEVIVSSTEIEGMAVSSSSAQQQEAWHDLPSEVIKFNYAKISVTYTQQKRSDGQGGGSLKGGWDRTANKTFAG